MPILLNDLKELKKHSDIFVETGSHKGKTIDMAIACGFKHIYSIEFNKNLYKYCVAKYRNNKKVNLFHGSSRTELWKMIKDINERIVFWLDAHYSGAGTSMDKIYCPILDELSMIKKHNIHNHIILIDDIRLFHNGEFKIPVDIVVNSLLTINPDYEIKYLNGFKKDDVLLAI